MRTVIRVDEGVCVRPCVIAHERRHAFDMTACCDEARAARRRGWTQRAVELWFWQVWYKQNEARIEYMAIKSEQACTDKMWYGKKCDTPCPEDKQCCATLKRFREQGMMLELQWIREGGSVNLITPCPFRQAGK